MGNSIGKLQRSVQTIRHDDSSDSDDDNGSAHSQTGMERSASLPQSPTSSRPASGQVTPDLINTPHEPSSRSSMPVTPYFASLSLCDSPLALPEDTDEFPFLSSAKADNVQDWRTDFDHEANSTDEHRAPESHTSSESTSLTSEADTNTLYVEFKSGEFGRSGLIPFRVPLSQTFLALQLALERECDRDRGIPLFCISNGRRIYPDQTAEEAGLENGDGLIDISLELLADDRFRLPPSGTRTMTRPLPVIPEESATLFPAEWFEFRIPENSHPSLEVVNVIVNRLNKAARAVSIFFELYVVGADDPPSAWVMAHPERSRLSYLNETNLLVPDLMTAVQLFDKNNTTAAVRRKLWPKMERWLLKQDADPSTDLGHDNDHNAASSEESIDAFYRDCEILANRLEFLSLDGPDLQYTREELQGPLARLSLSLGQVFGVAVYLYVIEVEDPGPNDPENSLRSVFRSSAELPLGEPLRLRGGASDDGRRLRGMLNKTTSLQQKASYPVPAHTPSNHPPTTSHLGKRWLQMVKRVLGRSSRELAGTPSESLEQLQLQDNFQRDWDAIRNEDLVTLAKSSWHRLRFDNPKYFDCPLQEMPHERFIWVPRVSSPYVDILDAQDDALVTPGIDEVESRNSKRRRIWRHREHLRMDLIRPLVPRSVKRARLREQRKRQWHKFGHMHATQLASSRIDPRQEYLQHPTSSSLPTRFHQNNNLQYAAVDEQVIDNGLAISRSLGSSTVQGHSALPRPPPISSCIAGLSSSARSSPEVHDLPLLLLHPAAM